MDDLSKRGAATLTLDTCDLEPIHTPGRIQPFGMMLAGPGDLSQIDYCSANVEAFLGSPPEKVLGVSFADVVGSQLTHDLRNMASLSTARTQRERVGLYDIGAKTFEVYLHINPQSQAVVEFMTDAELV